MSPLDTPAVVELDGILYRVEAGLSDSAPLVEDLRSGYPTSRGELCTLSVCRITDWDAAGETPVAWSGPMTVRDARFAPIAKSLGFAMAEDT